MSTGKKVIASSLLLVASRFLQRMLGLLSTIILARLLVPDDFGIVAVTAISVQFAEVLSNSGIKQYIPQKDEVNDVDLNTAWSLDLCLKFALWMILLGSAPYVGDFFDNPAIVSALQVVSVVIFLRALQNPGLHLLRRNLNYSKIFRLTLTQKFISFIAVIAIALHTRSYWAMIVGDIVYALVGVAGSYYVHSYRPKITLAQYKEQWRFSKWLLARGVVGFFRAQIDQLMVSKIFGIGDLGAYNVVRSISVVPATDVIVPSVEPLLASFSRVKKNIQQLGHQLRSSLLIIFLFIVPVCSFLVMFPDSIVLVLLGEQWKDYGDLLANLSILLFTFSIGSVLGNFYLAIGKVKMVFFYNLASLAFIFGMLLQYTGNNVEEFALNRGIFGLISTLLWLLLALYFSGSNLFRFFCIISPPVLAALLSVYLIDLNRLEFTAFLNASLIEPISVYIIDPNSLKFTLLFIKLIVDGFLFIILYSLMIITFYLCGFFYFKEWNHLKKLLFEIMGKFSVRFS